MVADRGAREEVTMRLVDSAGSSRLSTSGVHRDERVRPM
jgi:hypothetical protein